MNASHISNKVFLVTGGTGSFGTTVISRLLQYKPQRIIIFSRDEKKQHDMRNQFDSSILKFVIGDVREKTTLERVIDGVDYIFHAAALKQVPACEFFPLEAIKTNIFGGSNVIELAQKHKVKKLVVLSTDKAVYPINAMGMTKALMEKLMVSASRNLSEAENQQTSLCGVRYGNVMYSRGSVLPFFVGLLKSGKQLTVTNPHMTRFLLPLSQSVDLVLHALLDGINGSIYVRKSPAATVEILAEAVCKIFRYEKGVRQVGIRAGEKMHETLISAEEWLRVKDEGNYFRIQPEFQGLEYDKYFSKGQAVPSEISTYTSENTKRLNADETVELLLTLPEIQDEIRTYVK
jgi:UDP-N-acetylglucosamine 4,6-dehydratase